MKISALTSDIRDIAMPSFEQSTSRAFLSTPVKDTFVSSKPAKSKSSFINETANTVKGKFNELYNACIPKLNIFGIPATDFTESVKLYGAKASYENIEKLKQLQGLPWLKDSNIKLKDVPGISTALDKHFNNADLCAENLLTFAEKSRLNDMQQLDLAIVREEAVTGKNYEKARKIYNASNHNFKRQLNPLNVVDFGKINGAKKYIVCQESEIANAKNIRPQDMEQFVSDLTESNIISKELLGAYKKIVADAKKGDRAAQRIVDIIESKGVHEVKYGSDTRYEVQIADLFKKGQTDLKSLSSPEIHAITDIFKKEILSDKAAAQTLNKYVMKEISAGTKEIDPKFTRVAGTVRAMQDSAKGIIGNDITIRDHAMMRLIDRDLINPTDKTGNTVSFETLIKNLKAKIQKSDALTVKLNGLYSDEGKEITVLLKRNEGKVSVESFM